MEDRVMYRSLEEILGTQQPVKAALPRGQSATGNERGRGEDDQPAPGEQPATEELSPIDHAAVPPLTTPDDTSGG
jgi:hypothetical protein